MLHHKKHDETNATSISAPTGTGSSTLNWVPANTTTTSTTTTERVSEVPLGSSHHHDSSSKVKDIDRKVSREIHPVSATATSSSTASTQLAPPPVVQTIVHPTVVQENIHPIQKEEIQPIVHREREQLEVERLTQHLHETQIAPTLVEHRELAPEFRSEIKGNQQIPEFVVPKGGVSIGATEKVQVVHQPIVEETIKKTIIQEVQPVIHRDVVAPTVINETLPIYERIVETPIVHYTELPPKELGVKILPSHSISGNSASSGLQQPQPGFTEPPRTL